MSWRRSSRGSPVGCCLASSTMIWVKRHAGNVVAGLRVNHLHVFPASDQPGDVFQIDIAAGGSVVESAIRVLLDHDRGRVHRDAPPCCNAQSCSHSGLILPQSVASSVNAAAQHKHRRLWDRTAPGIAQRSLCADCYLRRTQSTFAIAKLIFATSIKRSILISRGRRRTVSPVVVRANSPLTACDRTHF